MWNDSAVPMRVLWKRVLVGAAIFGIATGPAGVSAMGFFDFAKVCIFSEVNGVVVHNGEPLAGAKLTRTVRWKKKDLVDSTTSDADGRFKFDVLKVSASNKFLPVEPVIPQRITISHNGEEHVGWKTTKRDYDENGELAGKPLNLRCDLSGEMQHQEIGIRIIQGLCTWD